MRTIGERNLIVVSVVERFRKRVRGAELIAMREALFEHSTSNPSYFVLTLDSRFATDVRTAHHRIEHGADGAADDEMRAEVVQIVGAQQHSRRPNSR